jgi:hypothetical protein
LESKGINIILGMD